MNTYRTQFVARCPSDGERILYSLELQTDQVVMVESIKDCLDEISEDYQENIAQRIRDCFPKCRVMVRGVHQGVEIVSVLEVA